MKNLFLLLAATLCATSSAFAVTYELNGGMHNPYGWGSKDDMMHAFLTDGKASECTLNIADFQAMAGTADSNDGLHNLGLCKYLTNPVATAAYGMTDKWGWLETYVKSVYEGTEFSYSIHYGAGAFFISGQSLSWPKGPSFADAGKEENYFPAWGYNYNNPETVTETFTLYAPTKEGDEFEGWYTNPEFTGEPVVTIDATTTGTLYAKWKIASGVEMPVVEVEKPNNVYTINGVCVLRNATPEAVRALAPGFYIVGGKKHIVK